MNTPQEHALLLAHVEDLLARADGGEITYTAFLTPHEQRIVTRTFGARAALRFDGGYACAERQRLFCLPPWFEGASEADTTAWLADVRESCLVALRIQGSGFRELYHKDYLGAILNLGIERAHIGDVCVIDTCAALLFCDRVLADFLAQDLHRVANDAVSLFVQAPPPDFDGGRRFAPITDTVASPRADSVVAALANLSRDRACELLRAGAVEIDYETTYDKDASVPEGVVIVIRGKGKFIIRSLSEQTRKGRYRLLADKYL